MTYKLPNNFRHKIIHRIMNKLALRIDHGLIQRISFYMSENSLSFWISQNIMPPTI
ncbi:hypothetical protein Scep_029760 [Stephania cephalantha]|uniref:Uncharacterized protein n=1 Tax=Stephania cephalantha TaxID=152367 RepID=A0AAP0E5Z5_9MAGN